MTKLSQRTIGKDVSLTGVGIHSGESATITLRPGNANTGIRFRRLDLEGCPEIPAKPRGSVLLAATARVTLARLHRHAARSNSEEAACRLQAAATGAASDLQCGTS